MRFFLIAVLLLGSSAYARASSQATHHASRSGRSARAHHAAPKHAKAKGRGKHVKAGAHHRRVAKKAHHR